MGNRKAVIDMAQVLAESGYDVEYSIEGVPGGTGIIYNLNHSKSWN